MFINKLGLFSLHCTSFRLLVISPYCIDFAGAYKYNICCEFLTFVVPITLANVPMQKLAVCLYALSSSNASYLFVDAVILYESIFFGICYFGRS